MCKSKAVHSQFNGTAFWAGGVIDCENVGKGQPNKRRTYELSSRHHLAFCHEQPLGSLGKPIGLSGIRKGRHCPSGANPQPFYAWRAPILKEALPPEALPQKQIAFFHFKFGIRAMPIGLRGLFFNSVYIVSLQNGLIFAPFLSGGMGEILIYTRFHSLHLLHELLIAKYYPLLQYSAIIITQKGNS